MSEIDHIRNFAIIEITENLNGIERVYLAEEVSKDLELPVDREADVAVIADNKTVIGGSEEDHDLSALKGERLRTHGSLHEAHIPFVISEPLNNEYQDKAGVKKLRSHQIFDFAINGTI